jgi:uncharacterized protein (DUF302 family)
MRTVIAVLLALLSQLVCAKDLYMVRSALSFPEAMSLLQETIGQHGYKVSRVQRVDIGLTTFGYQTDKYRVVFFGKLDDVRQLSARHSSLVPYLPLKIAIFAEGGETILLASSFQHLRSTYSDPELQRYFDRWEADVQTILEYVRVAE